MNKFFKIFLCVFLVNKIYASIGGTELKYSDFPYIGFKAGSVGTCVAVIINQNTVLSSAHCIHGNLQFASYSSERNDLSNIKLAFSMTLNPDYKTEGDQYDLGSFKIKDRFSNTDVPNFVNFDPTFEPFQFINSQLGKEVLFDYIGIDPTLQLPKLWHGTMMVSVGERCFKQVDDLIEFELAKFDSKTQEYLLNTRYNVKKYPSYLLCVFNNKSDKIRGTSGDSGSPLLLPYNGKLILAGTLVSGRDISKSEKYNSLIIYSNISLQSNCNFVKSIINNTSRNINLRNTIVCKRTDNNVALITSVLASLLLN